MNSSHEIDDKALRETQKDLQEAITQASDFFRLLTEHLHQQIQAVETLRAALSDLLEALPEPDNSVRKIAARMQADLAMVQTEPSRIRQAEMSRALQARPFRKQHR